MTFIENVLSGLHLNPAIVDAISISITLIIAFIVIKIINYLIKKTGQRFELEMTVVQVLQEIFKYTVIIIAVVMILNELGINVTALILSLGIVGIAVGFAARDTLSNFISGLFILGHKSFKVGDIIEVSDHFGIVTKMGFRVTTLTTTDNKVLNIPNSLFSTQIYLNYTALECRRIELAISIPQSVDLDETIKSLIDKALNLKWVL
ncbi:MAG TPA: mechanosensitive ion channel family protein, partial [Methanobacterium sp.]|nr:mechanosensitive ion channel family protein [Methanobacterium sp.]